MVVAAVTIKRQSRILEPFVYQFNLTALSLSCRVRQSLGCMYVPGLQSLTIDPGTSLALFANPTYHMISFSVVPQWCPARNLDPNQPQLSARVHLQGADCVSSDCSLQLYLVFWGSQIKVFHWAFSTRAAQVSSNWAQLSGLFSRLSSWALIIWDPTNWALLKQGQVGDMLQAVVALSNWAPSQLLSELTAAAPQPTTPQLNTADQSPIVSSDQTADSFAHLW